MAAENDKGPLAGGCLMCIALLAGALAGIYLGQPSIGVLAGFGTGLALLILIWLWDRTRR